MHAPRGACRDGVRDSASVHGQRSGAVPRGDRTVALANEQTGKERGRRTASAARAAVGAGRWRGRSRKSGGFPRSNCLRWSSD